MPARRIIEPSQLRKRKRRRRVFRTSLWIIFLLVIVFALAYFSHLPALSISNITFSGNEITSSEELSRLVHKDISGNYSFIFSRSNILLYPKQQIKKDILESYSRIESLSIHRTDLQSIHLDITERKPYAIWCKTSTGTSSDCFFIDKDGYAFARSGDVSGNIYFFYYGSAGAASSSEDHFLPPDQFTALTNFLENVKKIGIEADSLRINEDQNFELHLQTGGYILFSGNEPFDKTFVNLQTVTDKNNSPDTQIDLSKIEYLDLRNGNKIFYKLKGQNTSTSTPSA